MCLALVSDGYRSPHPYLLLSSIPIPLSLLTHNTHCLQMVASQSSRFLLSCVQDGSHCGFVFRISAWRMLREKKSGPKDEYEMIQREPM